MKKIISLILTLTTVFLSVSLLFSCAAGEEIAKTDEELVIERVNEFLDAYNNGDWEAVMECLEPKVRNQMQALINLMGGVAGGLAGIEIDLRDLFALGVSTVDGDFMNLRIIDCSVGSSTATVTTSMSLNGVTQKIYMSLVKEKGEWLISDMSDKKSFYDNVGEDENTDNDGNLDNNGGNIDNGGNDNTDSGENSGNITEKPIENIVITDLESTEVEFLLNGKSCAGVTNSDGEIFYYVEEKYISWTDVGKGGIYTYYEGKYYDTEVEVIVSEDGREIATSKSGEFDDIIGYGDGLVLVYKNTGDMTKTEHSYGVINTDGTWVQTLSVGPDYNELSHYRVSDVFIHQENGIFVKKKYAYDGVLLDSIIFDSNNNTAYSLNNCKFIDLKDGLLYGESYDDPHITKIGDPNFKIDLYNELSRCFSINRDGKISVLPDANHKCSNSHLLINTEGEYVTVYNTKDKKVYSYTDVPFSYGRVYVWENFFTIKIYGADGRYYAILLNDKAEPVLEPIPCSDIYYVSEGVMIYKSTGSDYFSAIDFSGKVVATAEDEYTSFDAFCDGLALIEKEDGEKFYINKEGKRIALKLYAE